MVFSIQNAEGGGPNGSLRFPLEVGLMPYISPGYPSLKPFDRGLGVVLDTLDETCLCEGACGANVFFFVARRGCA